MFIRKLLFCYDYVKAIPDLSIFKFLTEKAREFTQAICTMASFYYSYQNLSEVRFLVQIRVFCYLNLNELTRFKYERKNEMNQV